MRNFHRVLMVVGAAMLAAAVATPVAVAQGGGAAGGGGRRMYDVATETTIHGTVTEVRNMTSWMGGHGMQGMHVLVDAGGEVTEVHLGPASFMKERGIALEAGDAVTVLGSRVTMGGTPVVVARKIDTGERSWTLRDETGRPLWAGRGRRGQ